MVTIKKGTFKATKPKVTIKKGTVTIKTSSKKKPNLTRFRPSRKTYRKQQVTKKMMLAVSESKLLGVQPVTQVQGTVINPAASPASLAYKYISVLGSGVPPTWNGVNHSLGGVEFIKGIDSRQRIGDYLFLRNTTLTVRIEMIPGVDDPYPTQFRMVIFKSRRAFQPAGTGSDPSRSLFLKQNGEPFGYESGGISGFDLMMQPLNKRGWSIMRDTKFILQSPSTVFSVPPLPGSDTFINVASKYGFYKQMRIVLPHQIKAHYENALNQPDDYDFRYCIAIFAHSLQRQTPSVNWDVSIRGTTAALDN